MNVALFILCAIISASISPCRAGEDANLSHTYIMNEATKSVRQPILHVNLTEEEIARFHSNWQQKESGCHEWMRARNTEGYGYMTVQSMQLRASRLAWMIASGPIPEGMWILHRCDNPPCVNPEHLFLGGPKANTQDMLSKGRRPSRKGDLSPTRILSGAQVVEMRSLWYDGVRQCDLARRYSVSPACVRLITKGKRWQHLLPAPQIT